PGSPHRAATREYISWLIQPFDCLSAIVYARQDRSTDLRRASLRRVFFATTRPAGRGRFVSQRIVSWNSGGSRIPATVIEFQILYQGTT
ncbi:MAG: hypothetical protein ACI8P0_002308, partial [Planctomycetaceae bacterium]